MKLKFLIIAFVCFFLCGCSSGADSIEIKNLEFTAEISYCDTMYVCECVIEENGEFKAVVKSPERLSGMDYSFKGEDVSVRYLDLQNDMQTSDIPANSPILILYNAISQISTETDSINDKKNCVAKGEINGEEFEFVLSPSGLPISIEFPNMNFKANFKNVTLK